MFSSVKVMSQEMFMEKLKLLYLTLNVSCSLMCNFNRARCVILAIKLMYDCMTSSLFCLPVEVKHPVLFNISIPSRGGM